jgi:hypothetical protein
MLLVTVGRYFPKLLGNEKIYCPHEKCVHMGVETQYTVMVGLFFIPIIPAARVKEWRCTSCNGHVVPNEGGKHSKNVLLFSSIVALGGFAMFGLFTYWVFSIGGKNSAINPDAQYAAKVMAGFFAFLGLCIVAKALWDARCIARGLSGLVTLTPDQLTSIAQKLEPGDNLEVIATKLTEKNFSDAEIRTYTESWSKPEAT